MAVSEDRKYTKAFVHALLESVKGKTLGEVDTSHQYARTEKSEKITGIAGDDMGFALIIDTFSTYSQNSIPIFQPRRTNRMASLLYGQINASQSHKQTNVLTSEHLQQAISCTHARYPGRSSTLRASAPL